MTSHATPPVLRTKHSSEAFWAVVLESNESAAQCGASRPFQVKRRRLLGPFEELTSGSNAVPTYDYETHVSYARRSKHVWRPAEPLRRVPAAFAGDSETPRPQSVEAKSTIKSVSGPSSFRDAVERPSVNPMNIVMPIAPMKIEQCIGEQAPAEESLEVPITSLIAMDGPIAKMPAEIIAATPTASPRSSRADGIVLTEDVIEDEWAFITEEPNEADVIRNVKRRPEAGRGVELMRTATPLPGADGFVRGVFSDSERLIVMGIFEKHTADGNVAELEDMIQHSWPKLKAFKADLQAALPMRTMVSISKFCKRYFHHLRGSWTTDEDLVLKHSAEMYPGQWTKIAELVGNRSAEECRHHYRNVVKEHNLGPWTLEEERRLTTIVEETFNKIGGDRDPNELDWPTIAKHYEGRNGRQCRRKFVAMSRRQNQSASGGAPPGPPTNDRRVPRAERDAQDAIRQFDVGDYYDVLHEIQSMPIDSRYQHDSTFWSILAKKFPQSRFSPLVRRLAFGMALDGWECDDKSSLTIPEQAVKMLQRIHEEHGTDRICSRRNYEGLVSGPIKGYGILDFREPYEESDHAISMPLIGEAPRTPDSLLR